MAAFVVALVKVRTVNLTAVALALNPVVKAASNYRRVQRFLAGFEVDFEAVARLTLALLPVKDGFVVTIDLLRLRIEVRLQTHARRPKLGV